MFALYLNHDLASIHNVNVYPQTDIRFLTMFSDKINDILQYLNQNHYGQEGLFYLPEVCSCREYVFRELDQEEIQQIYEINQNVRLDCFYPFSIYNTEEHDIGITREIEDYLLVISENNRRN